MAVILTGTEYIDLDAHGAALDIRQRPLAFYAELQWTATEIMLAFSHGRGSGGQEWALFQNITATGRITGRWESDTPTLFEVIDSSGTNYADGNLHRALVVARTSSDDMDLYVDGAMVGSTALGANVDTRSTNNLTRIGMDPDSGGFFFVGQISNVALWDVEIADADAQDLTAGTIAPGDLTSGIVEWWPLDFDARGEVNGLDGTPVNNPSFTESPAQDGSASGSYGYTGTASGQATVLGSADGSYAYAGTAQGQATVLGSASGSYAYAGTAAGQATVIGSASGQYGYEGTAIGTGEATGVEPVVLPPYREPAPAAFREPKIPAFREPPP